jgi:hypothetical protein
MAWGWWCDIEPEKNANEIYSQASSRMTAETNALLKHMFISIEEYNLIPNINTAFGTLPLFNCAPDSIGGIRSHDP